MEIQEQVSSIREDVSALKAVSENNTKQIDKFFDLLDEHMDQEDKKVEKIHDKLWFMSVALAVIIILEGYPLLKVVL